jgi:hypothetical protein
MGGCLGLQAWCGGLLAIGDAFILAARTAKVGTEFRAKV